MKVLIDAVDDRIGNYDSSRDCERCRYLFCGIGPNGEHIDGYNCLLTGQRTYDYYDIHHEYLTIMTHPFLLEYNRPWRCQLNRNSRNNHYR